MAALDRSSESRCPQCLRKRKEGKSYGAIGSIRASLKGSQVSISPSMPCKDHRLADSLTAFDHPPSGSAVLTGEKRVSPAYQRPAGGVSSELGGFQHWWISSSSLRSVTIEFDMPGLGRTILDALGILWRRQGQRRTGCWRPARRREFRPHALPTTLPHRGREPLPAGGGGRGRARIRPPLRGTCVSVCLAPSSKVCALPP